MNGKFSRFFVQNGPLTIIAMDNLHFQWLMEFTTKTEELTLICSRKNSRILSWEKKTKMTKKKKNKMNKIGWEMEMGTELEMVLFQTQHWQINNRTLKV